MTTGRTTGCSPGVFGAPRSCATVTVPHFAMSRVCESNSPNAAEQGFATKVGCCAQTADDQPMIVTEAARTASARNPCCDTRFMLTHCGSFRNVALAAEAEHWPMGQRAI